jgi:exopolyphosphatase / guanosine-5'-triphosphate,3'-diphosphate pyrophosphatase
VAGERSDRVAVIDIGSNSTRLLVAEVAAGRVGEIERRTRVTRLGRGVDLSGNLSPDGIEAVCEAIGDYLVIARESGVDHVTAVATSAVRDAGNGDAFRAELRERFALDARAIDGEQEALLTYRGATSEAPATGTQLVVDIGGGSTELIVGTGAAVEFHTSLQAGVVRHSERHLTSDPPTSPELETLARDIGALLGAALAERPATPVDSGIAVAGTPTSLAAIDLGLEKYDPRRVHGHRLSIDSVQRSLSRLATLPLAERSRVTGLHPDRAATIVAGTVILIEVMRAFGLEAVTASEHDILYGAALETSLLRSPNSR